VKRPRKQHVVRRVTESGNDPVLFGHEDQGVARAFVARNHPRGGEVYTETPDGYREVYSADLDYQGSNPWTPLEDGDEE
jgi:hypothetical protein